MENGRSAILHPPSSILVFFLLAGCQVHQPANTPATQPSLATTQPSYWISQPGASSIDSADFDKLWSACEASAWHFGFQVDRRDYRAGVITTEPLISKQFFELWRNDVVTADDLERSSLATYRRTLRFQIEKRDGHFRATPCVVIERYALAERPIAASVYLRRAFRSDKVRHPVGTPESDRGIYLPRQYWYATGRDAVLEKNAADEVGKNLRKT